MTPSAVSYHVKVLEEEIGTPLLYRSTRHVAVTDQGKTLYEASVDMLNAARYGLSQVGNAEKGLSGTFRMTLVSALSGSFIAKYLAAFAKEHPKIQLDLHYDHRHADLVGEQFDLAIRTGRLESSSLICKLIWRMPRTLVASPDYLKRIGPALKPEDLEKLCWLKFDSMKNSRTLIGPAGNRETIIQSGNVVLNSIEAMVDLALEGVGLASPPTHCIEAYLKDGRLVEVLPGWIVEPLPVYAIWPSAKVQNPMTQAFLKDLPRKTG